MTKSIVKLL